MPIETLRVTLNSLGGWTNNGGANGTVSVSSNDGDTSYIKCVSSTNGIIDYDVDNCVVITGSDTINSVTVRVVVRTEGFTNNTGEGRMTSNAWSNQLSHTFTATTSYSTDSSLTSTTRPQGGVWTLSDVNALKLRLMGDDFQALRVTEIYVDVDYTVPSGNKGFAAWFF